ncbi:serine/threonine-protein phosphatase 4 regulatory subunit 2 [Spea bombifrons]|uniref:serine/threonine-protein phosphatase 4 regulatory subunit 2 n=1 Tax=Spea bombifrons TaxID=233779 RepID=UPI00234ADEE7|nr:serine/threonine-protein phosphatase 4 regulatory subunit 2 [Spea bombifrons]
MDVERLQEALKDFEKRGKKEVCSELDQFLCHVAKTGETIVQWPQFKEYFMFKLEKVMDDFRSTAPEQRGPPNPNVEYIPFDEMKERILKIVTGFNGTPFTIQRLCELVTDPRRNYTGTDKFLRGVEKNVMVVSCVYPSSEKNSSTSLNRMNGVMFPSNSQSYTDRSNVNGPGTPRPLSRPKLSLSSPMTTNGLPDSLENKDSDLLQKEKAHSDTLSPNNEDSPTSTVKNKHSEEDLEEPEEHEVKRLKFDPEEEEEKSASLRASSSEVSSDMTEEEAESASPNQDPGKDTHDPDHSAGEESLMTASDSSEEDDKNATDNLTVNKETSDESHQMEETEQDEAQSGLQMEEQEKAPTSNCTGTDRSEAEPHAAALQEAPEAPVESMENSEEAAEVADEPMEQD